MKYIRETEKSVADAVQDVQKTVARNGFGVLHVYDLKATLASKGVDLAEECHILEICNPLRAKEVLDADISMNMALPCRVSIYSENGKTKIGMIRPGALLEMLSDNPALAEVASEVEATTIKIIDEAV